MNRKIITIALPQIKGAELRNAIVDLEKEVIIAEYGQEEEWPIEAKRGDFLTLKTDPSKVVIFNTAIPSFGKVEVFTIMYSLPMLINGGVASTPLGTKFHLNSFRHSTEEEKQLMIKEMAKWGKRYNPKTYCIENIEKDISKIAVDFKSATYYLRKINCLREDTYRPYFHINRKHEAKLEAFNQLILIAEAWNSFDKFKPDWNDRLQKKYYSTFEVIDGKFEFSHVFFIRSVSNTHTSSFSFKTEERAEQFGKQFIDLFRIVLTD